MYQGKFSNKNNTDPIPEEVTVEETPELTLEDIISEAAPVEEAPARETSGEEPEEAPVEKKGKKKKKKKSKKKKGNRTITLIFYTLYFLMIIGFFGGMYYVTQWLTGWLTDYEASQPTTRSQEVFEEYFADPDWALIYDLAGIESGAFEDRDDFVTYMENRFAGVQLTYMETSAGLSGDHKYTLKNGEETIGYFTLTDKNSSASEEILTTELPDWQLDQVSVGFTRSESVTIQKLDGHTAYVNGIPVSDDYTTQMTYTLAESYLPQGTTGFRQIRQQVAGLLIAPEVTIMDENGNLCPVVYDEETGMYAEQTEETSISKEEKEAVISAAQTYGLYMIEKTSSTNLSKYWKSSTDIYKTILRMEMWMQDSSGHEFVDVEVSDYVRYNDELFSARISYKLNVTRKNSTVKEYPLDTTLFFEKQKSGKWMAIDMTNVDIQELVNEVRVTFLDADGNVISSSFVKDDARELTAPTMTVPDGQQFAGWFTETVDDAGTTTLTLAFQPAEDGTVTIPMGSTLTPMVLQPVFEPAAESEA